jgi:nucleoid DNA-binding protein
MTKKDMAKAIAEAAGVTQAQALEIVQRVFEGITETLVQEGRIELRNFGVFEVKKRKPRQAQPPHGRESCGAGTGRRHLQAGPGDGKTSPKSE